MSVRADLVYDVGAASGSDTAYYLHKGYNVVAVEANPLAASELERRFDAEIRQARLTVIPLAIAESEGEAVFWVCDDEPERSSFDRSLAGADGMRRHSTVVRTCRFATLMEQFGTPFYCKIDIEGCDALCLNDLTPATRPPFISAELLPGDRHIERLRELGYGRFKIISQRTFRPPARIIVRLKARAPHRLRIKIAQAEAALVGRRSDDAWKFPPISSGPFGESTRGRWQTADEALALQRLLETKPDDADWYDVHAAAPEAP